jgi:hypothetical protein
MYGIGAADTGRWRDPTSGYLPAQSERIGKSDQR